MSDKSELEACVNTDVHLWPRELPNTYAPTVHGVTDDSIGIEVDGLVIVQPIRTWHAQAARIAQLERALRGNEFDCHGFCPSCDGWMVSKNGATRRAHTKECPVGIALAAGKGE